MHPLLIHLNQQIERFINNKRCLIAFSGGLDSSCLLSLLTDLRSLKPELAIRAIHINHGLSHNAMDWQNHCVSVCQAYQIPLITQEVDIDIRNGVENGARQVRYNAIANHILPNEVLVTAHHLDDQTETFFLALKRGSGVQGLSAMLTENIIFGIPIFRPLLNISRVKLEEYAHQSNLQWVEDESNQDSYYERNFLRNEILPLLRKRWPFFDNAVMRSTQHCFEQQQLTNELLQSSFTDNYDASYARFSINCFSRYSDQQQKALLRMWLNEIKIAMPSTKQLAQLIKDVVLAHQDGNPQFRLNNQVIRRYQHFLYCTPVYTDISSMKILLEKNQTICLPDNLGSLVMLEKTAGVIVTWEYAGEKKHIELPLPAKNQPITVRFSYSGKVRVNVKRKNTDIKKVWQKLTVPPWLRQRIPLIFYAEQIKAAVGFFAHYEE